MRSTLPALLLAATVAGCSGDAPENQYPVAVDDVATTDEDVSILIDLLANDSDPEGDVLDLRSVTASGDHQVVIEDGKARLTPAPDFHGDLLIEYRISDGLRRARSSAIVTVRPVNDAPVAVARAATAARNATVAVELAGTDVDGDVLTFEVTNGPAHGTLTGDGPFPTYTPAANYVGEDAVTFVARDGQLTSAPATLAITVGVGQPPVAQAATATTAEDVPVAVTVRAVAGSSVGVGLTYVVTTPPAHGTLTGTAPDLTYTPAANYHGPDSFRFSASDQLATSAPATVSVTITPVNDAPVATPGALAATEDIRTWISLGGADVDGDRLTFAIATHPTRGTVAPSSGGNHSYLPTANLHGVDAFTFTVSDGTLTSAPATVAVTVASVEDAPIATGQTVAASEDVSRAVILAARDDDGDPLTFTITGPTRGTLTGTAPALTYLGAANFNGTDSFTFTVSDGRQATAPQTVWLQVAAVNDPPTATAAIVATREDEPVIIDLAGHDVEGAALTFATTTAPTRGALVSLGAGRYRYTPNRDYHGMDGFQFQAAEGALASVPATVTINVSSINDPPTVRDDAAVATAGRPLTIEVLGNDVDVDGDVMTLDGATAPDHGSIVISGDDVVFTPAAGFTGTDRFSYTVRDATGATSTGVVRVGLDLFPAGVPVERIAAATGLRGSGVQQDLSADGRYLTLLSAAALTPGDTNNLEDVFVYDRVDGSFDRVSVSSAGVQADAASERPRISADGRYVAFASAASSLVPGDTNGAVDVFVHDRVTGTTVRASVGPGGAQVTGDSRDPDLSANGQVVVFVSTGFQLVANDANGAADVFVRDLEAGVTTRVSVRTGGGEADQGSSHAAISGDGRFVAFASPASNLVAGDGNVRSDVFIHQRSTGVTERVSVGSTGTESDQKSQFPVLSDDGRFVGFLSEATTFAPGTTDVFSRAYVRDRQAITTTMANAEYCTTLSLSADGRYLTTQGGTTIWFQDRFANRAHSIAVPSGQASSHPSLSSDGRYFALIAVSTAPPTTRHLFVLPNPL